MKRYTKCPTCNNADKETFLFCAVGHSICCKCGFGESLEECKSKEDRIKRFFESIKYTIEDGDIRCIFDFGFFVRNTIDKINKPSCDFTGVFGLQSHLIHTFPLGY